MRREIRELLEGIIVYARLLDNVNKKFTELITQNIEKELNENEHEYSRLSGATCPVFESRPS